MFNIFNEIELYLMKIKYAFTEYIWLGKNKICMTKIIVVFINGNSSDIFTFCIIYMDKHDH